MIVAINYADKKYKKQQSVNSFTAKYIGRADKVLSFSLDDVDSLFREKNREIFAQKRGAGCWLWKPYIILKTLKTLEEGDYLMYADAGAAYFKNIQSLITQLELSKQDIMLFQLPLVECQWTKKEVFLHLDAYNEHIRYSQQIMGSFILLRKTKESVSFIQEWLSLCENANLLLQGDIRENEDAVYIAHREDQSLLSVLAKLKGINPFSDPSDYGRFPTDYLVKNRFFLIQEKQDTIAKVHFLNMRKGNYVLYFTKYMLKSLINRIGFRKVRIK